MPDRRGQPQRSDEPLLSEVDFASALALVQRCADAPGIDAFQEAALDVIDLIPGVMSIYNDIDLVEREVSGFSRPAFEDREAQERTFNRLMHQHPVIAHMSETGDTAPLAISDCLSFDEFSRLEIYREFFAPLGIVDQIAVGLPSSAEFVTGMAVSRATVGFDQRARALLRLIAPHLGASYLVARARSAAAPALGLGPSAKPTRSDLVVVDERGEVSSVVGEAAALIRRYFDLELEVGAAPPRDLVEALEAGPPATGDRTSAEMAMLATRDGSHLWGRLVSGGVPGVDRILLLLDDPERVDLERATRLGLSERERTVANLLSRARSNQEIATRLGISPHTVKRHLEHIYAALEVGSRAEAIVRLLDRG